MKDKLVLILGTAGLVLLTGVYWFVSTRRRPMIARPDRALIWLAPDGKRALVHSLEEHGGVFLYEVGSNRLIKHFSEYEAPVTGDPWSDDSRRFLLIRKQDKGGVYEAFDFKGHPLTHFVVAGQLGFKALWSPDGRYVVAILPPLGDQSGGLLIWDTGGNTGQYFPMTEGVEQVAWTKGNRLVVRVGVQPSVFYLLDIRTSRGRLLRRSKDPIELGMHPNKAGQLPLLVRRPQRDTFALFEVERARLVELAELPKTDLSKGFRWQLLGVSQQGKVFLWRWVEVCQAEVVAFDPARGTISSAVQLPCPILPRVDREGRIWKWSGYGLQQIGELE